ncbi:universal stress protein [Thermocoleostomius sinensis]|uniref:Universal stress protein n=1 Tax=Thermocoleostomius sinensis A174 TaxID=2016057 RepID=A0A9E8ZP05_9CYAN|nr:universal stress protein [Thermocoleostomius sinensis]WAL62111.1 universal stress protein [Thermocoleostomius sinensis A174]
MFQKILVALDNAKMDTHVFDEALALAKATGAHLRLLYVVPACDVGYAQPYTFNQPNPHRLRSLVEQANNAGVKADFTEHLGDPAADICAIAQRWDADLIVLGRRGLSRLGELLHGSVSNYVLHHAPCAVLVVQEKKSTSQSTPTTPKRETTA